MPMVSVVCWACAAPASSIAVLAIKSVVDLIVFTPLSVSGLLLSLRTGPAS
jgi:hypothetical protein